MELWYKRWAQRWEQALPAGNGRLGCMLFGAPAQEHLQLNEDSVWSGGPRCRLNPDAAGVLPRVREQLRRGEIPQAEELALMGLSATPNSQRCYQTLGDLYVENPDISEKNVENYRRSLLPDVGMLRVEFDEGDTHYTRTAFISHPDGVLSLWFTAEGAKKLHLLCRLDRDRALDESGRIGQDAICFTGQNGGDGIAFACMLRCIDTDGEMTAMGDILRIENATHAFFCLDAETSFRTAEPLEKCRQRLEAAKTLGFDRLWERHLEDFGPRMGRTRLTLAGEELDSLPTDERLRRYRRGESDPGLEALFFQFGRYLLLSSSRNGSLPPTLQGIWNREYYPPWDSKYTININIEMNYWPAETCGLSDCCQPLFDLLSRMRRTGAVTAREMYGCRGFTAHHNTDIWADTAPQDQYIPATYWPMGAAWLCTHIWEHYRYTLDRDFLRDNFETLEQCVLFFEDYLEQDGNGYYVTNPSVSPENTYIMENGVSGCMCIGSTMDEQILRHLFGQYLEAAAVLDTDNEITKKAREILPRLRPTQIGSDGRLLEWAKEYGEAEPGHRHISHLYGLTPGQEIDLYDTPALAAAARKTLETRLSHGGGHTGWSRAWIIRLWARLGEGGLAHDNLRAQLTGSVFMNLMDNHPYGGRAGLREDLEGQEALDFLGSHPDEESRYVFQVDGNLGASAAMAEFLVQEHGGQVRLLPALPEDWKSGSIRGVGLPGGVKLSLDWAEGRPGKVTLESGRDTEVQLRWREDCRRVQLTAGVPVTIEY